MVAWVGGIDPDQVAREGGDLVLACGTARGGPSGALGHFAIVPSSAARRRLGPRPLAVRLLVTRACARRREVSGFAIVRPAQLPAAESTSGWRNRQTR